MLEGVIYKYKNRILFKTEDEYYKVTNKDITLNIRIKTNEYNIHKKTIFILSHEILEYIPERSRANFVEYGSDFETWVKFPDGSHQIIIKDRTQLPEDIYDLEPEVLLGSFVSRKKTYIYDATREPEENLQNFLLNKENKRLRFFNLGYDGSYIINLLDKWGFKHTTGKPDVQEFNSLVNKFGKMFGITYRYVIDGKIYKTEIFDTANIFVGMSLEKALKAFKATDFDGNPIEKLDADGFEHEYWFDENGQVVEKQIEYAKVDALGALRLYDKFTEFVKDNYTPVQLRRVFTIGSASWTDLLKRSFKKEEDKSALLTKKKLLGIDNYINPFLIEFKEHFGHWSIEYDKYFRQNLYRGGYNLLNDYWYNITINETTWHADINSAYPYLLKEGDLCGKLHKIYRTDVERKPEYMYIYDIAIHETKLRPGWFPVLQEGRKTERSILDGSNYITDREYPIEFKISVFDVELDKALEAYEVFDYEIRYVYECERVKGEKFFGDFVDHWFHIKETSAKDDPNRAFSKLMLNAATGKIGENPEHNLMTWERDHNGIMRVVELEDTTESHTRSVPLIASITAQLRMILYESMQAVGFNNVLLAATDCILVKNLTESEMEDALDVGTKMGTYELEPMTNLLLLGEKMYQYTTPDGTVITKANGLKREVSETLKFGELQPGLEIHTLEKRKLKTGSVLIPKTKEIKERGLTFSIAEV